MNSRSLRNFSPLQMLPQRFALVRLRALRHLRVERVAFARRTGRIFRWRARSNKPSRGQSKTQGNRVQLNQARAHRGLMRWTSFAGRASQVLPGGNARFHAAWRRSRMLLFFNKKNGAA